ncbi:MAG: nucleotidyltransferase family protein [Planctomycetaceae bacterium]
MAAIRAYARRIEEQFQPEQIILFGSHAKGESRPDSDIDLLVIMPTRNEIDQSLRISVALETLLPVDLIVRTPKHWEAGLTDGDWFLREIQKTGKVLYAQTHRSLGTKGGSRLARSQRARAGQTARP